jgi:hypothetical protein
VNTQLVTNGSKVYFNGPLGDTLADAKLVEGIAPSGTLQTTSFNGVVDINAQSNGIPIYGYLSIAANVGGPANSVVCQNGCLSSGTYLFNPTGLNSSQSGPGTNLNMYDSWQQPASGSLPTFISFYYTLPNGDPGQQDIGMTASAGTLPYGYIQPVVLNSSGAFAANSGISVGGTGSASLGATGASAGNGASSGDPGGVTLAAVTDVPNPPDNGSSSVTNEESRRTTETQASSESSSTENDNCPRGAGVTADLGQRPGVQGASLNVFARCAHSSSTGDPTK